MSLYRIYNQGELPHIAHGWRSVVALPPGRKYITVLDWTTLEHCKVTIDVWQRLKPELIEHCKASFIRKTIKSRLAGQKPSQLIRSILNAIR